MSEAPRSYTSTAVALHWVMAVLILLNLLLGFLMETCPNPSRQRNDVLFYHASVGILILALLVIRLGWRFSHRPPPLPDSIPKIQRTAAHGLHWTLYLLVLLQPISGYVHRMAGAHLVSFFGLFDMPILIARNEPLRLLTDLIHDTGAIVLTVLVVGHIAVALKHRFIDHDSVLQRMIPVQRPSGTVTTTGDGR